MNRDGRDEPADEFADIRGHLEGLAQRLDAERFPGKAWQATQEDRRGAAGYGRRSAVWRPLLFRLLPGAAAAAALVAAGFLLLRSGLWSGGAIDPGAKKQEPTIADRRPKAAAPRPDLRPDPVLLIEDIDSYSLIDLSGEAPLVTFARKDPWDLAVPTSSVLLDPTDFAPLQRTTPGPRVAPPETTTTPNTTPKRRRT